MVSYDVSLYDGEGLARARARPRAANVHAAAPPPARPRVTPARSCSAPGNFCPHFGHPRVSQRAGQPGTSRNAPLLAFFLWAVVLLVSARGAGAADNPAGVVDLDTEEAKLELVLGLLSRPRAQVSPGEDLAETEITFAAKGMPAASAVRWLLRTHGLVALPASRGAWKVVRPEDVEHRAKVYKVGRLTPEEMAGDRLVEFIRSVVFAACPWPSTAERLKVQWQEGRLRVVAPSVVHKEVAGVLNAMAKAALEGHEAAPIAVKYAALDIGLFRGSAGAPPAAMKGKVELDVADVTAPEAARRLTMGSKTTFYVDPLDSALCEAKVTLRLEGTAAREAAEMLAEELKAETVAYDGAWVFVRSWRKPLYGDLVVRAYSFPEGGVGRAILNAVEGRVQQLRLPKELPYAIERVGDVLLVSLPREHHERFEALRDATRRWPGGPGWRGKGW